MTQKLQPLSSLLLLHSNPNLSCSSQPFLTCPACAPPTSPPETLPGSAQTAGGGGGGGGGSSLIRTHYLPPALMFVPWETTRGEVWVRPPERFQMSHILFFTVRKTREEHTRSMSANATNILQPYCCCTVKKKKHELFLTRLPRLYFRAPALFSLKQSLKHVSFTCCVQTQLGYLTSGCLWWCQLILETLQRAHLWFSPPAPADSSKMLHVCFGGKTTRLSFSCKLWTQRRRGQRSIRLT